MINLAILKLLNDDRNSFSIEEWKRLHQIPSHATHMKESAISQYNEEVKTDLLYMTSITTPEAQQIVNWNTLNTETTTLISEELPLRNLMANEREEISSRSQTLNFERKDKMSTKVIDETTLRIYFPKASNIEPVTQDLPLPTITPSKSMVPESAIEVKDKEEAINTQGFSLWLILLSP